MSEDYNAALRSVRSALRAARAVRGPRLVIWGFHPAHGNVPMKLGAYSAAAARRREAAGWSVAAYAPGDDPAGLALQAEAVRARAAFPADGGAR